MKNYPKSKEEWKSKLTIEQHKILREKGTEPAFSGKLLKNKEKGIYNCAGCGNILFSSEAKFNSGCGWPSFYESYKPKKQKNQTNKDFRGSEQDFYDTKKNAVKFIEDNSLSMKRTEVVCSRCNGHLGHIFPDAPQTPTGNRYCINSLSLDFKKE